MKLPFNSERECTKFLKANWSKFDSVFQDAFSNQNIDIGTFVDIDMRNEVPIATSWRRQFGRNVGSPKLDFVIKRRRGNKTIALILENKPKGYCEVEFGQIMCYMGYLLHPDRISRTLIPEEMGFEFDEIYFGVLSPKSSQSHPGLSSVQNSLKRDARTHLVPISYETLPIPKVKGSPQRKWSNTREDSKKVDVIKRSWTESHHSNIRELLIEEEGVDIGIFLEEISFPDLGKPSSEKPTLCLRTKCKKGKSLLVSVVVKPKQFTHRGMGQPVAYVAYPMQNPQTVPFQFQECISVVISPREHPGVGTAKKVLTKSIAKRIFVLPVLEDLL